MAVQENKDAQLQHWLDELRGGNPEAAGKIIELIEWWLRRTICALINRERLKRLSRWETVEDLHNEALARLFIALQSVHPDTVEGLRSLARKKAKEVLVDRCRHHFGAWGYARRHQDTEWREDSCLPMALEDAIEDEISPEIFEYLDILMAYVD